jgi:hypothetical protein
VGVWTGRDDQQRPVTYSFAPDGTGYRTVGDVRQGFVYELTVGYPNLIRIEVESERAPEVSQGLVQLVGDSRLRLELREPGAPAPAQVSSSALVLQRLPTR